MSYKSLIGKEAPALTLPNYDGEEYKLVPGEGGLPIALFFYPKSGTYGCTKEACRFRDAIADKVDFSSDKLRVVGISSDPVDKQKAFVEKNKLTYPVLSDSKGDAHKAYKVGRRMFGLSDARTTFIIDGKGVVREALDATLNFGAHPQFIAKWVAKLEAEKSKEEPTAAVAAAEPGTTTQEAPDGQKETNTPTVAASA